MAWESFGIDQYEVCMVAEGTPGNIGIYAFIRLHWLSKQRATLWFYRDGVDSLPANTSFSSGGITHYYGRFRQTELGDVVDLLRHEKPIFFQYNETTKGAILSTGKEPVGEHELP